MKNKNTAQNLEPEISLEVIKSEIEPEQNPDSLPSKIQKVQQLVKYVEHFERLNQMEKSLDGLDISANKFRTATLSFTDVRGEVFEINHLQLVGDVVEYLRNRISDRRDEIAAQIQF